MGHEDHSAWPSVLVVELGWVVRAAAFAAQVAGAAPGAARAAPDPEPLDPEPLDSDLPDPEPLEPEPPDPECESSDPELLDPVPECSLPGPLFEPR
jgi:hypothetical protein